MMIPNRKGLPAGMAGAAGTLDISPAVPTAAETCRKRRRLRFSILFLLFYKCFFRVPRRGAISLAVGATHGQETAHYRNCRPRRGRIFSFVIRRQTKFNPFGVGESMARIVTVGFTHGY